MRSLIIGCIRLYQRLLSPLLGNHCRFEPSCSQYAIEALQGHGVIKGGLYAFWRLLRCNPFCRAGYDPVPQRETSGMQDKTRPPEAHTNILPRKGAGD